MDTEVTHSVHQDGGVDSQDGGVDTEVTHSVQSGWRRGNRGYP